MCEYGCNQESNFTLKNGKKCCSKTFYGCKGYKDKINATKQKNGTENVARGCFVKGFKKERIECKSCGEMITKSNYEKHKIACESRISKPCANPDCETIMVLFPYEADKQYCCIGCTNKSIEYRAKTSKTLKEKYQTGEILPYGGHAPRHDYFKLDFKRITVQGSYELKTCFILDNFVREGKIKDWDYTNDRFPYKDEKNKDRTYFPDFKVFRGDDTYYYLETKGVESERDAFKWKGIRKTEELVVWFNDDIMKHIG